MKSPFCATVVATKRASPGPQVKCSRSVHKLTANPKPQEHGGLRQQGDPQEENDYCHMSLRGLVLVWVLGFLGLIFGFCLFVFFLATQQLLTDIMHFTFLTHFLHAYKHCGIFLNINQYSQCSLLIV